jgi:hypothetical protein
MVRFKELSYSIFVAIVGLMPLFFTISCKKQTAQLPANKVHAIDSSFLRMEEFNRRQAEKEDRLIAAFLKTQPVKFIRSKSGIWYEVQQSKPHSISALNDSTVTFDYQLFTMTHELIQKENHKTIRWGKKEIPTGLEEGLKLMHKGETGALIVPSYLAYGAQGTDKIEPYTTLFYQVSIK